MKKLKLIFIAISFICFYESFSCTIFSARDHNGQVWVGNNEDNTFSFYNYINVFPSKSGVNYGYYTLSYHTPENGENFNIQGGMNEAGLFFDFNILSEGLQEYIINDIHKKKSFPGGDQAILSHILATFSTVEEVLDFFEVYWFDIGFKGAQMHLADRNGHFAMIDPTGSRLLTDAPYQLSTNFSICAKEDESSCWRYPIARDILDQKKPSLLSFTEICKRTAQKGPIATIYSNIQNLTTGDINFFFGLDYNDSYSTNISSLLDKGRKSYLIRDLFPNNALSQVYRTYIKSGALNASEQLSSLKLESDIENTFLAAFVQNEIGSMFNLQALPFLESYLKSDPIGHWMTGASAIAHFNKGEVEEALHLVNAYYNTYPETSMDVKYMRNRFKGIFPAGHNTEIKLKGYKTATHVFVKGLPDGIYNFMSKTTGGWIFKKKLPDGIYNFSFVVDGKELLDPTLTIHEEQNPFSKELKKFHRIAKGRTLETYETTIRVTAPNATDEVYLTGDQNNLANWTSVFRMRRVSEFEREIKVQLHFPAMIKFTRGNWSSEGIVAGYPKEEEQNGYPPVPLPKKTENVQFDIIHWKDKL